MQPYILSILSNKKRKKREKKLSCFLLCDKGSSQVLYQATVVASEFHTLAKANKPLSHLIWTELGCFLIW